MPSHLSISKFERKIGIRFKNKQLIEEALTHKSYAMENGIGFFNERLEFLGDSILNAVITEFLYLRYPKENEGQLSKWKSQLVAKPPLYKWAKEIKLGSFLRLSEGEEISSGRDREGLLADAMESVFGAIFLDQGFERAQKFILKKYSQRKRIIETDFKSKLQEVIQKKFHTPPTYTVISVDGPDHEKTFTIEVRIQKKLLGQGSGKSKKDAEKNAAKNALKEIKQGALEAV